MNINFVFNLQGIIPTKKLHKDFVVTFSFASD